MKNKKKLSLRKEKITELSKEAQVSIKGGMAAEKTGASTDHNFTCCWCMDIWVSISNG